MRKLDDRSFLALAHLSLTNKDAYVQWIQGTYVQEMEWRAVIEYLPVPW
jgi:hypothetical protein